MMIFKIIAAVIMSFLLVSCSMFSPVPSVSSTTYLVNSIPPRVPVGSHRRSILFVAMPETSAFYNTTDMVYISKPYQIGYFVKNNWAETPAQMLQPLIVQTLINTHHFRAVNSSLAMGNYDYVLSTQIMQFAQDFSVAQSVYRLTLRVQIIKSSTNQIVATKQIAIIKPAQANTPYAGVIAANSAVADALLAIAEFCNQKI
jgi:cholesterol transport system auxiliary component